MSAIAGLLRFDGGTVTRHGLERVANALRQHGPDRADVTVADGIGLAHVLMRMTPEDQFDRQPWQGGSGAMITADVRLDNRDEMLGQIGVMPGGAGVAGFARVLAGWEKLGDALWPILRGPFAAAIWDSRRRVLTLARDHLGLNVVMWHRSERFFAFATMPNGLFALDDVPRQLSEEKFADFLVLNHADHATTLYRHVFRLPPAHVMRMEADGSFGNFAIGRTAEFARPASAPIRLMRMAYANVSIAPCAGKCAAPIRSAACSAVGSILFRLGAGRSRPGREERTACGFYRRAATGFDGRGAGRPLCR